METQSVADAGKNEMPISTLLVGNDSLFLVVLKSVLEKAGCTVRTASNGTMALSLMAGEISSIAIVDGDLPDFSACNLAHHLKAMAEVARPSQRCCTIWICDSFRAVETFGFDHVLDKPLQHEYIVRVLKQCEEASRQAAS